MRTVTIVLVTMLAVSTVPWVMPASADTSCSSAVANLKVQLDLDSGNSVPCQGVVDATTQAFNSCGVEPGVPTTPNAAQNCSSGASRSLSGQAFTLTFTALLNVYTYSGGGNHYANVGDYYNTYYANGGPGGTMGFFADPSGGSYVRFGAYNWPGTGGTYDFRCFSSISNLLCKATGRAMARSAFTLTAEGGFDSGCV